MYESIVTRMFMLMSDVFNSLPNEDEIFQNDRFKQNFPQLIIKLFSVSLYAEKCYNNK